MNNIHAVNYIRRKYYLESYKRGGGLLEKFQNVHVFKNGFIGDAGIALRL